MWIPKSQGVSAMGGCRRVHVCMEVGVCLNGWVCIEVHVCLSVCVCLCVCAGCMRVGMFYMCVFVRVDV